MSVTSAIVHPPNERLCIVRESYQAITGNDCEAALLNVFEQWHKCKTQNKKQARSYNETAQRHGDQPSQLETVYIWNTATELSEQLLGLYKETTVKVAVKSLAAKGFITIQKNPNPAYGFDRKNYYTFEVEAIQSAINEMFFAKTPNAKVKNDRPSVENDPTLVEIDRAITKNTYKENNTKNTKVVETSSTPSFESEISTLNAEKKDGYISPELSEDFSATSYGEIHKEKQKLAAKFYAYKWAGFETNEDVKEALVNEGWRIVGFNDLFYEMHHPEFKETRNLARTRETFCDLENLEDIFADFAELHGYDLKPVGDQNHVPEVGEKVSEKTNDTEAVETPQNVEPIQSLSFQNKTAPEATESTDVISNGTGSERENAIFEETTQPTALKPPKLQGSEKVTKKATEPLHKPCVEWFVDFYKKKYLVAYDFQAKDAKAVSEILKYLRKEYSDSPDLTIETLFKRIVSKTENAFVLKTMHQLPIIASNKAQIAAELKAKQEAEKKAAEQAKLNALNPTQNEQPKTETYSYRRAG